ncbi:rho GTPase-activating protein 17-like [Limulus polyphemus]|uniref:Rho GTPase-activating protein 17-like n=1 Tax=Limulus polyphemus TaxID=6850 RepID=A0ABM1BBB5_LIMPO|nr:rho GTPase-activating protein 17-like [Limulus polyphemus]
MKKQFFRVKQIADQTFLGAEKTEVLTEDLVSAEKRVELIKQSCQNIAKKAAGCLESGGMDLLGPEKRLKKLKEIVLSQCMLESSGLLGETSILGIIFGKSASLQEKLGKEILQYEMSVEEHLLTPIGEFLENDIPNISKLRKHLNKLTLDMDSARSRYQTAIRHSNQQTGGGLNNAAAKADVVKEELEDASLKVEQCKDNLAAEMYALLRKEPEFAKLFVDWYKFQANYHHKMLNILEECIPSLDSVISEYPFTFIKHGLFRIAGSALKAKKLKNSFDAGIIFDLVEYARDPHCVAGALKSYLRELPEPLLTFDLYEEWTNAAKTVDPEARLQALWQVLLRLPEANHNNLRYIIKFLAKLATNSDVNKMSPQNIAIVFAPNLIWGPDQVSMQFSMNMSVANVHSIIVDSLVSHADWFFPGEIQFYVTSPPVSVDSSKNLAPDNQQKYPACNGDLDSDQGGSLPDSLTTSPVTNSPKPTHRPSKKPAPPTPGGQQIESIGVSERTISQNHDEHSHIHCVPPTSFEKLSKSENIDLATSTVLQKVVEPSGKPECPFIVQSHENMSGNVIDKVPLTRIEKPEKPEKPTKLLLYSTNSLDHKRKLWKGEKPPLAPRHTKLSNHTEKSSVPLPGISLRNHISPIEKFSSAPPEKPSKPEKLTKPVKFSESFKQLSQPEDDEKNSSHKFLFRETVTKNLAESKVLLVKNSSSNEEDTLRPCEHEGADKSEKLRFFQLQKSNCEDLKIAETVSQDVKTTGSGHASKQNRWSFLTSHSAEKTPEKPPRIIPPSNETSNKDWDLTDSPSDLEETKTCFDLSCQKPNHQNAHLEAFMLNQKFQLISLLKNHTAQLSILEGQKAQKCYLPLVLYVANHPVLCLRSNPRLTLSIKTLICRLSLQHLLQTKTCRTRYHWQLTKTDFFLSYRSVAVILLRALQYSSLLFCLKKTYKSYFKSSRVNDHTVKFYILLFFLLRHLFKVLLQN